MKRREPDLEKEDIMEIMQTHYGILGATEETNRGWEIRLAVRFPGTGPRDVGPFEVWVPRVYPSRKDAGDQLRYITEVVADAMEQVGLEDREDFDNLLGRILGGH